MSESPLTHKSSLKEKFLWGAGGMTESLVNSIYALAFPIFGIGMGVSSSLIGMGKAIPRLLDAVTDPLMGNISDNTRTRWGRRRPYIFVGAICVGILMPLIYMPPRDLPEMGLFLWFTGFLCLFFLGYTIWNVPWGALGLELSSDYHDRTRLQVFRMIFATLAGLAVAWVYKLAFLFSPDEVVGVRPVVWIVGGCMMGMGLLPALFVKEWRNVSKQHKLKLRSTITVTLKNKPFLCLCAAVLTFAGGTILVEPMTLYVNIFHVFGGDRDAASTMIGISGTTGVIVATLMLPVGGWVSSRIGKKRSAYLALALIVVGKGSQFWLFTPEYPYLQLVSRILYQPGIMLMWALIPSMLADVCDYDEALTGNRREASYSSIYQWIWKLGATLAMTGGGFLLALAGAGKVGTETTLSPDVVFNLRWILAVVPACLSLIAMGCVWLYPLSEERIRLLQQEVGRRETAGEG